MRFARDSGENEAGVACPRGGRCAPHPSTIPLRAKDDGGAKDAESGEKQADEKHGGGEGHLLRPDDGMPDEPSRFRKNGRGEQKQIANRK